MLGGLMGFSRGCVLGSFWVGAISNTILTTKAKWMPLVGTHLGANNNPESKIALATVPMTANKMALTPSNILSTSPKMMVMSSGWLSRVCTQEEQEASGCQQERLILLSVAIYAIEGSLLSISSIFVIDCSTALELKHPVDFHKGKQCGVVVEIEKCHI